ncbi:MAG: hypothetical protein INR62_05930 [Rhodospirillales bacterium]|nr:hypothetical protein [Acetobacter sp.]
MKPAVRRLALTLVVGVSTFSLAKTAVAQESARIVPVVFADGVTGTDPVPPGCGCGPKKPGTNTTTTAPTSTATQTILSLLGLS